MHNSHRGNHGWLTLRRRGGFCVGGILRRRPRHHQPGQQQNLPNLKAQSQHKNP